MADNHFVLPDNGTISIDTSDAQKLIDSGSGEAALLYIYILKNGGRFSFDSASSDLKKSKLQLENAMAVLSKLGLVSLPASLNIPEVQHVSEIKSYSASDIKNEIENGSDFKFFVSDVERSLGKILSSSELLKLFGIYSDLHISPEALLQLITFCISECRRKYGPGRMPTMNYIEKTAYTWERSEIFTIEDAEKYLTQIENRRSIYGEMKSALCIKDRDLTPSEQKYVDSWIDMGFGRDAVEIAFDKTVLKTGKLSWGYLNSILKSWHSKNLHTPKEIEAGDVRPSAAPKTPARAGSAPTSSDMERMRKMLKSIQKD